MESIYEPRTNISGYHYALRYFKMTNSNLFNYEANNMNAGLRKTNGKGHLTSDLGRDFGELKSMLRLKGTYWCSHAATNSCHEHIHVHC